MRIKIGTVREDITAFGNRFYIQVEDTKTSSNLDLKELVDKEVLVIIGPTKALDNVLMEQDLL